MTELAKTIIYTCPYVPAEWIAAHGLRPRRLIPLPMDEASAIPRAEGLCPYARAFAGDVIAGNEADGIVVTTVCDQMRRVFDLLTRRVSTPAFLLNVPSTWQTVAAQRLYVDELKRLGRFLVRLGGHEPDAEELTQVMLEYENAEVHTPSPPAGGRWVAPPHSFDGVDSGHQVGCAPHTSSLLHGGHGVRCTPYDCHGVPIAVVGGPLMQRDQVLFDIIGECGGHVVLDATETGQRGRRPAFDRRALVEDPLLELARAYFSIPDASRRPNSELYTWLKRELGQSGARGIIFHHYVWCDLWRAEVGRLREWVGLPVLDLDSDGHSETNVVRSRGRIRAFMEMLQ